MERPDQHTENAAEVWNVGVCDAHCHPTDVMTSIKDLGGMKAKVLTIMASRSQDQELVAQVASEYALASENEVDDSSSCRVIPAFGWHPWVSHQIFDDRDDSGSPAPSRREHYDNGA